MAFDLPTQIGYDSDAKEARGSVGKVGVAIDSIEDMEALFDGIPVEECSVAMTINATAPVVLAFYMAMAEERGIPLSRLQGTTQNDILKEYVARGTYIYPVRPSLRLTTDLIEYCFHQAPKWNTLSITGVHMREAGADVVQEVAFTIAHAIVYIEAAVERGLDVDEFAPRLSYSLGCYRDLFEEVAKFRAARRMFARVMRKRFNAQDPRSAMFRIYCGTLGSTLTRQEPENNIVRIAMHALIGALGGAQAIFTAGLDEAFALPTERSARIALRTQQMMVDEFGITNTIDPLGGSYYVESLTNEIEDRGHAHLGTNRCHGRDDRGTREWLGAAGHRGVELRLPAQGGERRACVRRDEQVPGRRATSQGHHRDLSCRPCARDRAVLATRRAAGPPRRRSHGGHAAAYRSGGARQRKPDAAVHRSSEGSRHFGRDLRRAAHMLGRAQPHASVLTRPTEQAGDMEPTQQQPTGAGSGRIRVVAGKPGLDGHDRGIKVVTRALRDAGMEVIYLGMRLSVDQIADTAIDEDADVVAVNFSAADHLLMAPMLMEALRTRGCRDDLMVVVGGIIPDEDIPALRKIGIAEIFLPGTPIDRIIDYIQRHAPRRRSSA